MNNMRQLFSQAQKLQAQVAKAQAELETQEVTGTSGAGAVSVTITLKGAPKAISINKEIVNPEETDILEDLILAALGDAKQKADSAFEEGMKRATNGMDISKLTGGNF
ncbi:MAG: YbaB/EbfC family nucleoid-associated protein [Holosporales bacterium]|jgi:DNA-binding YbaB/EbfC family protein|nr:YbaB/EbfC family nucleoid-associated protein [Holosporales bacterium]